MPAPDQILKLVDRFNNDIAVLKSTTYNESSTRQEYIDPFFRALGWDVGNQDGRSEAEKEVKVEVSIRVDEARKAPDYGFYHNGELQFFVEAKKPSVDLKYGTNAAFQIRRYAWSTRKIALSLLTDFEELAIYDCRPEPVAGDSAATARLNYYYYTDYAEKWDEIAALFSREAVAANSLESYTAGLKNQKGIITVDAAFLKLIEQWRELLAKNLARRNANLSQRELNSAVQATIDRIIFLRFCEERDIEPYEQLKNQVGREGLYERLGEIFKRADARYNSGLFHLADKNSPDGWMLNLVIDDAPLKEIIEKLYYPAPYAFKAIPVEILGQVYEQFLGKVITLSPSHEASIEEKPEVRKAGGVYYTPGYIVEYIVKNTVGKLLEGQTPDQAARLKILDPACGSGSFLLGAYQFLLDWYLAWYVGHNPTEHNKKKRIRSTGSGWQLTTDEKKRILLNNLYGVDIDTQAVEVTKLSLLLKMVEDESGATQQLQLLQERLLPDLDNNIKCGNSLIGPDIYEGQLVFPDFEEQLRINVFDWQSGFPEVFKQGGFDAVIGNPPYIRMESFKGLKTYLKAKYDCHDERSDLYAYVIERSAKLLKNQGHFGMIVSNKFIRANYGKPLRDFLRLNVAIEQIVDFAGLPVFEGATVRTLVLLAKRESKTEGNLLYTPPASIENFNFLASGSISVSQITDTLSYNIPYSALNQPIWSFSKQDEDELMVKLKKDSQLLTQYTNGQVCRGVVSGLTEAFVIEGETKEKILKENPEAAEIIKPFLNGRDVRRYLVEPKNLYLIYTYHGVNIDKYPAVKNHLLQFKDRLEQRATKQEWYELQQPQFKFSQFMDGIKIIFPDISITPRFALDEFGYYSSNTTYFIPRNDLYVLALLNSRLGYFYFAQTCAGLEGKTETYLRFFGQYLEGFPVRTLNFDDPADKGRHDQVVGLVERMLDLHQKQAAAKLAHEKTALQRQIEATDRQIDQLVYQLYQLTPEEIAIVEG